MVAGPALWLEPRRMTLSDLGVLVAACAVALSVPVRASLWPPSFPLPTVLLILIRTLRLTEEVGLALALVVLYRRGWYGGLVRPAERLALALAALGLLRTLPVLDEAVNAYYVAVGSTALDFDKARWLLSTPATLGLILVLGFLVILRRWVRAGSRVAAALGVLMSLLALILWFWGPAEVARLQLPWLLVPSPPGDPQAWGWLGVVVDALRMAVGYGPQVLTWGILAAATVRAWVADGRSGRAWLWTEWAALVNGVVAAALILLVISMNGLNVLGEAALWAAGTGLASWWISGWLGPGGGGEPSDAQPSPFSPR